MQILVTGGAGYIGSSLVPLLLRAGHGVTVLDSLLHGGQSLLGVWSHPSLRFIRGDVRDGSTVNEALNGVEAVVHLAAIVGDPAGARDPGVTRAVNLDASLSLLKKSQNAGIARFIFASTCSNYGRMKDPASYVDETSDLAPVSLYAETKVAVEKALLDRAGTGDLCATALRFATVFGVSPRMRFDLTVNEFTAEMVAQKRLVVFGEQFWRPYIHVRDVAQALLKVLEMPKPAVSNRVFNIGSTEQNYQKQQIVELIRGHVPDACIEYVHKNEDPRDYRVSFERAKQELGFVASRTVADGVREVVHLMQSGIIENHRAAIYRN